MRSRYDQINYFGYVERLSKIVGDRFTKLESGWGIAFDLSEVIVGASHPQTLNCWDFVNAFDFGSIT